VLVACICSGNLLAEPARASGAGWAAQPAEPAQSAEVVASDPRIETIDAVLSGAAEEGLCGTILIRSHDKVLLHKAYGWADADAGREMTIETGFAADTHMTFFTSCAAREAESVWSDFREELVSLGKEGMGR